MSSPAIRRWDPETALLASLAAFVSAVSYLVYYQHGAVLLYGDAVAHINIARRVFDSRTPGLLQLGTVWLPLPHLFMIPFLLSDRLWRTGVGGSLPSLVAYVAGVAGIFRLTRRVLSFRSEADEVVRSAAWVAAITYGANPNLLYLQTTAMSEPLYLAWFIWAVVYFSEFVEQAADQDSRSASSALTKCGLCLFAGCLTRYDGWLLAAVMCAAAAAIVLRAVPSQERLRGGLIRLVALAVAAPVFWLGYNAVIYRNPLEFANGPYSARAIEQKASQAGVPPHPGANNVRVAASYFLKAAELNLADGIWQKVWLVMLLAGAAMSLGFGVRLGPLLLLLAPLPFYILSVAYGGVPIYLPVWWPFSYYNVRYGVELLPAFAVFGALVFHFVSRLAGKRVRRAVVLPAMLLVVAVSYASVWRTQPISVREAWVNSRTRTALESELASILRDLPANSTFLMYLGDHAGALQQAGIPLRHVIQEGNHRTWIRPSDPQGEWERALANPAQYADFVIAVDGDPVAAAMKTQSLPPIAIIHINGQPAVIIYQTHPPTR
ncbi:MAG TPA: hypothetical protein VMT28_07515 [Terriglobales bacterium]|jgi:hypothetical protein|nr:hypothetical protein [Terriglobales bacterium]